MAYCVSVVLAVVLLTPMHGWAGAAHSPSSETQFGGLIGPTLPDRETPDDHTFFNSGSTVLNWDTGAGRSYLIPAGELLAYLFLLNQYDRHFSEPTSVYRSNGDVIWQHLTDSKWVLDNDQFSVNQFLHPYGGNIY